MTVFKSILCVVDIREDHMAVLARAVALAENNQASLTVVDMGEVTTADTDIPDGGSISAGHQARVVTARMQALETLIELYRGQIPIKTKTLNGTRFLEIIRQVLRDGHDLVIKAPEKLAWLNRLFGSDDMNLLRECPCPVWFVKPQTEKTYRRILAAVDVDDSYPQTELELRHVLNQKILEMAASLALSDFAELHVVNAWQALGESIMRGALVNTPEATIIAYVEKMRRRHRASLDGLMDVVTNRLGLEGVDYLKPQTHLIKGWARKEIPVIAKRLTADVIVMGTVARTGIPGFFMGNTAETILSQIDCSVLAIKPPGFETPVKLTD